MNMSTAQDPRSALQGYQRVQKRLAKAEGCAHLRGGYYAELVLK